MDLFFWGFVWLFTWGVLLFVGGLAVYFGAMAWRTAVLAAQAERLAPPIGQIRRLQDSGARSGAQGEVHFIERGPDSGDERGPPIVLLHGNGGNLRHFSGLLDALAADRRVIALDRPGSGYSAPAADASLAAQSRRIWAALDALGAPQAVLVGHSLGGAVALRMALDAPQRTAAVALLAPAATPFRPKPPLDAPAIRARWLRRFLAATIAVPTAALRGPSAVAAAFAPDRPPSDYATAGGGILNLRPRQAETVMADWAALNDGLAEQAGRYGTIAAPLRALFGASDAILDPAQHAEALRAVPSAQIEFLDGTGHMLPFAQPGASAEVIRRAADEAARQSRGEGAAGLTGP